MPAAGAKGKTTDFPTSALARARAGLSLTLTASPQDVTDATITVTVAGTDAVAKINGVFDFAGTTVTSTATQVGVLAVDGVVQDGQALFVPTAAGGRATVAQTWRVPLAAGTHTLKLQAYKIGGTGTWVCYGTHTSISVTIDNPGN